MVWVWVACSTVLDLIDYRLVVPDFKVWVYEVLGCRVVVLGVYFGCLLCSFTCFEL